MADKVEFGVLPSAEHSIYITYMQRDRTVWYACFRIRECVLVLFDKDIRLIIHIYSPPKVINLNYIKQRLRAPMIAAIALIWGPDIIWK